ncbi:MAG TPA: molybdate ABC transporter substrate-binding protein [Acidimicrobiales bacterium]|nr:molybdate ABC transporter substrate-binding protein [Acidimicrobiales bacterium]
MWKLALAFAAVLSSAACGSDGRSAATSAQPSGSLTVFAAASLTEAFNDHAATLEASHPKLAIKFSFAGSGGLVTQVEQGAPADVIATADAASMKRLTDAWLVEAPTTFARNKLEILVAPGNPLAITGLADLARDDVKLVLGDESVPVGRFSAQALRAAGVTTNPVSREGDVKAVVAKVTLGEADVAIVYATDVIAAGAKGQGVVIPDDQNVIAHYPIAIVKTTGNRSAAAAFVEEMVRGRGQDALRGRGFLPAA